MINLVGEGEREMPRSDVPKSDLDVHGTPGEVVSVATTTLLESVLDEIDCVDDFRPESEDLGGDSETCPRTEGPAMEHLEGSPTTVAAISKDGGTTLGPRGARSESSDAETIVLARSLSRTQWYPEEGFGAPEGFDCSGIDATSSLIY